jgi:hypothetical protein
VEKEFDMDQQQHQKQQELQQLNQQLQVATAAASSLITQLYACQTKVNALQIEQTVSNLQDWSGQGQQGNQPSPQNFAGQRQQPSFA